MASEQIALDLWPVAYIHLCTHIWIGFRKALHRWRHRRLSRQITLFAAAIPPEEMQQMLASFAAWSASHPPSHKGDSHGEG